MPARRGDRVSAAAREASRASTRRRDRRYQRALLDRQLGVGTPTGQCPRRACTAVPQLWPSVTAAPHGVIHACPHLTS